MRDECDPRLILNEIPESGKALLDGGAFFHFFNRAPSATFL